MSPNIAQQTQVLTRQLSELATLRRNMQGLYETSQSDLRVAREGAAAAAAEAAREREGRVAAEAEHAELRRWNTKLAEDLTPGAHHGVAAIALGHVVKGVATVRAELKEATHAD